MALVKLSKTQVHQKIKFMEDYALAENAASGSKVDSNANVSQKSLTSLMSEISKGDIIQINRELLYKKIESLYSTELADEYISLLESHVIYKHDETSLLPYCVSISLYPLLIDGLKKVGGESKAPKHLKSFNGIFLNLMQIVAAQFAGAVATVEYLAYFDYFARKDFGADYLETHRDYIIGEFQQVVYTINQPAVARGNQSIFWNITIYDKPYFDSLFESFVFPDTFDTPDYHSIKKLQEFFLSWFNTERTKAILTFPVVTAALLKDKETTLPVDSEFEYMLSKQLEEGNSFFIYSSDSADTLSSCCRLRNEISDRTFSYSMGAGGVQTGSVSVITINMNRVFQKNINLKELVQKIQKFQLCYKEIVKDHILSDMLPVYTAGFINVDKQFVTIGINGIVEAAEFSGYEVGNNDGYINFIADTLKIIYDENVNFRKETKCMINTEFVPAENLGVKNFKWDKEDGLIVPESRNCYNSYLYTVENENINIVDKFILHGEKINKYLDGGSALHLNLQARTTLDGFTKLIRLATKTGCNYFCTNVRVTVCNDCEYISKSTHQKCPKCDSKNIDYATRIIGYLKRVSNWSKDRKAEHKRRHYHLECTDNS